jgi:hypothetical protein
VVGGISWPWCITFQAAFPLSGASSWSPPLAAAGVGQRATYGHLLVGVPHTGLSNPAGRCTQRRLTSEPWYITFQAAFPLSGAGSSSTTPPHPRVPRRGFEGGPQLGPTVRLPLIGRSFTGSSTVFSRSIPGSTTTPRESHSVLGPVETQCTDAMVNR